MQTRSMIILLSLSIAMTGAAIASEIFKWIDEDGNVQYSDKPGGGSNIERVEIQSRPTNPAVVQAAVQAMADARARREQVEADAPQGPTAEEQLAETRQREERCAEYTQRQVEFTDNRRIYRMDENGERVYYDEEEMQAARDKVDELVNEYCG